MRMGIVGLPQSGKKTLFSLIAGGEDAISQKGDKKIAIAKVNDKRVDELCKYYNPKKKTYATVEFVLVPSLTKDESERRRVFALMSEVNALLFVVRAFEDESVYHIDGAVDPVRDINTLIYETIFNDLDLIERRLSNIEKDIKRKKTDLLIREKEILENFKSSLENMTPLHNLEIGEEDLKLVKGFNFLSLKPFLILLNVSEEDAKKGEILEKVKESFSSSKDMTFLQFCAVLEKEISELESEEDKEIFLKDIGFSESAIDRIIKKAYETLGYISFFTVGSDEVRAWSIRKGSTAPTAAGAIHTDLERGFIRAEVMKFDDFVTLGSEENCKKNGKFYLKGKDYIVEDGDILTIRFNV